MASQVFSHVALSCSDPVAVEAFYTTHFGFRRARVVMLDASQIVFLKRDGVYLELFQADGPRVEPIPEQDGHHSPGWRHIAFQVDDVDARLRDMGDAAHITLGPLSFGDFIPGWRSVWLADPEGNIVEVSEGYVDQEDPPSMPA
jgi:glyoxylase I family protein